MKRTLALVLALMMCLMVFAACGEKKEDPQPSESTPVDASDLAYIQDKGKLTIGITIYEPMNYYDDKNVLTGFDTEFAQAVCAKLGVEADFLEINWDTKEIELNAKSIDCIWNGLTINEERKAQMAFSTPYVVNKQVVIIKADNKDAYKDAASLEAKTLVAEVSSAGEKAIADDGSLAKATYIPVSKQTDALLEVKSGTADAAVLDYVLAKAMVGEGTSYADLMIVEGLDLAVEEYGIGFRLDSDVVDAVNKAIDELAQDGTLAALADKYGVALTDVLAK